MTRLRVSHSVGVCACLVGALLVALSTGAAAQYNAGEVLQHVKIDNENGGFTGPVEHLDKFGVSLANIGDLDGDGVVDVVVGASGDDDGAVSAGAIWILFLNADGTVKAEQKISGTAGGMVGPLPALGSFSRAVAGLGDLDGDGVPDIAVGAEGDHDGGFSQGAVWILFLNRDGTVKAEQKISSLHGDFVGPLANDDRFGSSIAVLGDLNGDGNTEIAVGARRDDETAVDAGAMYVLFLRPNGKVRREQKINGVQGGFTGVLDVVDAFGEAAMGPGDLDGDGVFDLIVGAQGDDDGGTNRGAIWFLYLEDDGTVKGHAKISQTVGGFPESFSNWDYFGSSIASLGDLDGDGVPDLAVGARRDDDTARNSGAIWILFMNADESVRTVQKISGLFGDFTGTLGDDYQFAGALAALGDLDGDGGTDLIVSSAGDDSLGPELGSQWVLFLSDGPWVKFGHPLAGSGGKPIFTGDGPLTGGSAFELALTRAAGNASAYLVFGLDTLGLPFAGGTLVPDFTPPGNILLLLTSPTGVVAINDVWPTGAPSGLVLYFQYWIVDAGGPEGWAASNALRATMP